MTDVQPATPGEVEAVTTTLADAFQDGDFAGWLVPDAAVRAGVYRQYFHIFADFFLAYGLVEATDNLDAVALWWPVPDELDMGIPDYDERLAKACGSAVEQFMALDLAMHENHPTLRPHDYLAFLAVRPECHGHGLGSALLRHHHARLDHQALPAYLEATGTRNRMLYSRHGYLMCDPIPIAGDGPTLYPMWREPHEP